MQAGKNKVLPGQNSKVSVLKRPSSYYDIIPRVPGCTKTDIGAVFIPAVRVKLKRKLVLYHTEHNNQLKYYLE